MVTKINKNDLIRYINAAIKHYPQCEPVLETVKYRASLLPGTGTRRKRRK